LQRREDAETQTELTNVRQDLPTPLRRNSDIINAELEDKLGISAYNARGEDNKAEDFEHQLDERGGQDAATTNVPSATSTIPLKPEGDPATSQDDVMASQSPIDEVIFELEEQQNQ
jgi:hypothetical protein